MTYSYDRRAATYDDRLRQNAYNIARSLRDEEQLGQATRKLADHYFDLMHRSGSEPDRAKAAANLSEALMVEKQAAEGLAKLAARWAELFERAAKEHSQTP